MPTPPTTPWLQLWGLPQLLPAPGAAALPFAPERRFQLLALLALQAGRWVERDRVAALLWPGHALADARRNLRKVVHCAHAVPGTQGLEATEHALRWHIATDLQAFDAARHAGNTAQALAWRGAPPLEGLDDPDNAALAELLGAERSRIEQAWLAAALADMQAQAAPAARAAAARRVLAVDALDEPAMLALLQAELQQGRMAEAQAAYRRYAARLAQELGVEPARALRDLVQGVAAGTRPVTLSGPAAAASEAAAAADDGFVGRRLELAQARELLSRPDARCLTLLGPGGIGKSRLAQRLMPRCAATFPGGVRWVELQDMTTLPAALARLAQAVGATLQDSGDPVEQLLRQLPRERTLVVLDNAEQLPALTPPLQRLLAGAPALVLLATSRRRLNLDGEWTLPLAGLAVPEEDSRDLEAAARFDAVCLFEYHATRALRDFTLAAHLAAVIRIVEAVAGMPLAIELAAAWVRLLPPEQLAQDLQGGIDLLERDPALQGRPARPEHASLRAVLDGSWQLLAPRERTALAALSVFQGGFTRAAALAVAGCSLPLLSSLVDKSLLAVDEAGRFALHPVVAAYAAERLAEDPARASQWAARHAVHYAETVAALPRPGADAGERAVAVERELPNLLVALRHSAEHGPDTALCALVPALRGFFESRGRLVEGLGVLRPLLAAPRLAWPAGQRAQAELRFAVAWLLYRKGDLEDARVIAEAGILAAQAAGARCLHAACLRALASSLSAQGMPAQARPHFEQALALYREAGDRPAIATSLGDLGVVEKKLGHYDAALAHYRAALDIDREIGLATGIAIRLNNIANVHMEQDDWAGARQAFEEGLRQRGIESTHWLAAYLEYGLGFTTLELGAPARAQRHLEAARRLATTADLPHMAVAAGVALARVAVAAGRLGEGLEGLRAAAAACAGPDDLEERLSLALYYGEWLRAAGRPAAAVQAWRVVAAHAAADAGLRRTAQRWARSLQEAEPALAGCPPDLATLDEVIEALRDEPPWPDAWVRAATGNAEETPPA